MKKVEYQILKTNSFGKIFYYPQIKFNDETLASKVGNFYYGKLSEGNWYFVEKTTGVTFCISSSLGNINGYSNIEGAQHTLKQLKSHIDFFDNPPVNEIIPFEP